MKLFQKDPADSRHYYQPDPFIFKHDGTYYVYATGGSGVQLYRSHALKEGWQYVGEVYCRAGFHGDWAPGIMEKAGVFYLYCSCQPDDNPDVHSHRLQVATADSPEGPFVFRREICPPFSIDAHVFTVPEGTYLIYSTNDTECERPGTLVMLDKMTDPLHAEGRPVVAVRATMDEEVHAFNRFKEGEHWHTIEGGCYHFMNDTHFLLYSGAGFVGDRYFVGYALSHEKVSDLRDIHWQKYPDDHTFRPLLYRTDFVEGTGHNSLIEEDGALYIVYHARDKGVEHKENLDYREMRLDRVDVDGDALSVTIQK